MGKTTKEKATVGIERDGIQKNKKRKSLKTDGSKLDTNKAVQVKKNKSKKISAFVIDTNQDSDVESKHANKVCKHTATSNADITLVGGPSKTKRKKKDKDIIDGNIVISKNKKVLFNDDGQIQNNPQKVENKNDGIKQKEFLSGEEAAVTEEEIDRFCDELDEEDNKQFEDWVKLIEEKLNPKGNKQK